MQFSKWITLGFGALCLVAVAGVLRAQHLYYMAAILLTLPGISYLLGWNALRGLEFARRLPPTAWEGEEGHLTYEVRNRSPLARFFLTIQEPLPNWIVPLQNTPPLFNVGAQEITRVDHAVTFQKRGVYQVKAFNVTAMDPLGVFAFTRHVPCDEELVVYPAARALSEFSVTGSERNGWNEFTASAFQGSSVDPDGVRAYVPGDSLRRVHWRQTARTGRLSVIEFEETQSVNLTVALDLMRGSDVGSGHETTLEYGIRLAASLVQQALHVGANVRLWLPPTEDIEMPHLFEASLSGRGREHLMAIFDTLARAAATATQPIAGVLADRAEALNRSTTLLVITAHSDPALGTLLADLAAQNLNVAVVYVEPEAFQASLPNRMRPGRHRDEETDFLASLGQGRERCFVLRRNQNHELFLEALNHAGAD